MTMTKEAAEALKLEAEARKIEAETQAAITNAERDARKADAEEAKAKAEAEKARAEAVKAQVEADVVQLALTRELRTEQELLAANRYHHVYQFFEQVREASAKTCIDMLTMWHRTSPACDITIVFNSPGGSVIDGMALFDHICWLREEGHHVTTIARGHAASMAGILLQAGTHRVMGKEAWVLIHEAAFGAVGKTSEVEDTVKWAKRIQERILDIFVVRCKEAAARGTASDPLSKSRIRSNWKRQDWWLTSEECLRYGLIDEVA